MGDEIEPNFKPSDLGTKQYWDNAYTREVKNFDDFGDIGEIWFGESSVEKMIDWVLDNVTNKSTRTVDLGCGNGHLLLEMSALGYTNLVGVDYSEAAVDLAIKVADEQRRTGITYLPLDLLDEAALAAGGHCDAYDLALDKGTFDAISLATPAEGGNGADAHPADLYPSRVASMLKDNGILVITSCNWVEAELIEKFKAYFVFQARIKHPTFTFGGSEGQTITTVVFRKK
ncbi:S-adenosyl-L-methionine-dependent methyltransferase [Polychytrium aggregatum]|uniref:S-adenosyl-L-methionine-dependent methyltransferase n=1 Tax=Polychytrium aggregatum TaxID=110093 RepID=UPI0022FDB999|nr:S-adenosyl-L-methionine-dependent methyltransferase [Polychytrium aggregatum]KAI9208419.1 S-adenosyl-L-methionine-dependent methyltransferase [Polychytrium aggregatum]